jgi:hypothetical protein
MDFWTSGTQKVRIDTSGNVGIGTTAPGAKLEVNGNIKLSSTAGATATPSFIWLGNDYSNGTTRDKLKIYLYNSGTEQYGFSVGSIGDVQYHSNTIHDFYIANGNALRINSSGNVGIGTTSPLGPLEVYRSATGGLGGHIIVNNNGTAVGNETAVIFGDGGSNGFRAAISSTTENSPYYGDLKFKTGVNVYSSLTTKMIITGAGNVGIGTTSPGAILDVKASASSFNNKIATFQDAYTGSALDIKSQYSVGSFTHMGIQAYFPGSSPMVYNNIVINGLGGYVGIGVLTPYKILHVSGPIQIDDAFGSDPSTTAGNPRLGIGDVEGEIYLADPDVWLSIYLNGIEYVIPAYDPY